MNATSAFVTVTALAVAKICMKRFEAAVAASERAGAVSDRCEQIRQQRLARKWSRRLTRATTGNRRTLDAVIRWL